MFSNYTFKKESKYLCFVWLFIQTAIISLYFINELIFITETDVFTARYVRDVEKHF
jgi:hypothetical protein